MKYQLIIFIFLILGCKKALPKVVKKLETISESVVFIAGFDEGNNTYYTNAKSYFKNQGIKVVEDLFSIAEIISFLNKDTTKIYDKIHIVSHSNSWLGMSLKTTKEGERITLKTLLKAKEKNKIKALNNAIITNETKIIFHSCGLGENTLLLQKIKQLLTTKKAPKIIASSFFNVFGGKYAGHYLAKPYYGYYPTAESPGPRALSKEFKIAYPHKDIDWFTALKMRREADLGEVYSYKFNIPIEWEFTFDDPSEIPKLSNKDEIMDWVSESSDISEIVYNLKIPIEKYRWRSKVKGNTLYIKGKTTVLCVLEPILQDNDTSEYKNIRFNDTSLYQIL